MTGGMNEGPPPQRGGDNVRRGGIMQKTGPNDKRLIVWAMGSFSFVSYFYFKKLTLFYHHRYY
jgi:hypothetical protein